MQRVELPLSWTVFVGLTLALVATLGAGCRPGSHPPDGPPGKVADWLVDKLYVEVRQDQAIEATVGDARERIVSEQEAVAGLRGGQAAVASRAAQVFWQRLEETGAPDPAFTYRLTFASGGMRIEKELRLGLEEASPGVWRVKAITERDLPPDDRAP